MYPYLEIVAPRRSQLRCGHTEVRWARNPLIRKRRIWTYTHIGKKAI